MRANRQLRYAAPAIRTKDEGHWILLPMSSDTFVTSLPGRSLFVIRGMERNADEEHHDGEEDDAREKLHGYSLPI